MKKHIFTVGMALMTFALAAGAAETEYSGTFCSRSRQVEVLQSGPELTASITESWGIQTADSTFEPLKNATVRCIGYAQVRSGKRTSKSTCQWTDAQGDTFTGEAEQVPGKPGAWTFLSGTGKWNGVQGAGTFKVLGVGKRFADGSVALCLTHSGKYTLPQ